MLQTPISNISRIGLNITGVTAFKDPCPAQRRKFFSGTWFGTLPPTFCGGLQKMWRDGWPATEPPPISTTEAEKGERSWGGSRGYRRS